MECFDSVGNEKNSPFKKASKNVNTVPPELLKEYVRSQNFAGAAKNTDAIHCKVKEEARRDGLAALEAFS